MFDAAPNPFLICSSEDFRIADLSTTPPKSAIPKEERKKALHHLTNELYDLQRVLYAHNRYAVLLVFQAMDAAGKDSTIRAVLTGVNPAGCQVFSFKQPSKEELEHDFLWRTAKRLPERGRIGVFNRSYYEEVLVVRVHPQYLDYQQLPSVDLDSIWANRLRSIREHEEHLARNGTVVLKFWLNVSKEEQKRRFLRRLDRPEKNWKFSVDDLEERGHWDQYMAAYEQAIGETSLPWAPWYAIPADDKPFMRYTVAEIIVQNLRQLELEYPTLGEEQKARFDEMRERLVGE